MIWKCCHPKEVETVDLVIQVKRCDIGIVSVTPFLRSSDDFGDVFAQFGNFFGVDHKPFSFSEVIPSFIAFVVWEAAIDVWLFSFVEKSSFELVRVCWNYNSIKYRSFFMLVLWYKMDDANIQYEESGAFLKPAFGSSPPGLPEDLEEKKYAIITARTAFKMIESCALDLYFDISAAVDDCLGSSPLSSSSAPT
jgi:hypothetical protein